MYFLNLIFSLTLNPFWIFPITHETLKLLFVQKYIFQRRPPLKVQGILDTGTKAGLKR